MNIVKSLLSPIRKFLCKNEIHKWEWYMPNRKGTIIGTQWCKHCGQLRGVRIK
jgi:hypothetical protein